MIWSSPWDFF